MFNFLANALAGIGSFFSSIGSNACVFVYVDEPDCPKSLLK